MRLLAGAPNVAVKISGIGQAGTPWSVEANRAIVRDTIDIFGLDRCMFASNFPVDSLVASFGTIYSGFAEITSDLPYAAREALFFRSAMRLYRIPAETLRK